MKHPRTSNPRRLSRGAAVFLALWLCLALASVAAAESVAFTFNPPVPLTWKETIKTTRTTEGPQGTPREFVLIERRTVELVRSGDGYLMTIHPEIPRQLRNKREIKMPASPMEELAQRGVLTYTLDAKGGPVSVSGHLEIILRLRSLFVGLVQQTPEERQPQLAAAAYAVTQSLEPEVLLARIKADWGPRVSNFAGIRMNTGEAVVSEAEIYLPGDRNVPVFIATRLEEMVGEGPTPLARLAYQFDTDASALKDFAGPAFKVDAAAAPADTRVSGSGERLIDPSTLLIQSETQHRNITANEPGPDGKPVTATRSEVREYSYEFLPAPATE